VRVLPAYVELVFVICVHLGDLRASLFRLICPQIKQIDADSTLSARGLVLHDGVAVAAGSRKQRMKLRFQPAGLLSIRE